LYKVGLDATKKRISLAPVGNRNPILWSSSRQHNEYAENYQENMSRHLQQLELKLKTVYIRSAGAEPIN
jgi:hypothetical protein